MPLQTIVLNRKAPYVRRSRLPILRLLTIYLTISTRRDRIVKSWPVQDAKARFSELLDRCLEEGPQMVTKRGAEAAVLVPLAEWKRLQHSARPTLKELLLADQPRADIPVAPRGRLRRRAPRALD